MSDKTYMIKISLEDINMVKKLIKKIKIAALCYALKRYITEKLIEMAIKYLIKKLEESTSKSKIKVDDLLLSRLKNVLAKGVKV